jgi:hypothetical protein
VVDVDQYCKEDAPESGGIAIAHPFVEDRSDARGHALSQANRGGLWSSYDATVVSRYDSREGVVHPLTISQKARIARTASDNIQ